MTKRRLSMADEFLNKTEEFLDFVGVSSVQPSSQLGDELQEEVYPSNHLLAISQIQLPAGQPRRYFSSRAMESLITSVRQHGILQPMLVRPMASDTYELVAGERRYRAAQAVGLTEVPVVIRDLTSQEAIQVALLENLQREDLNPIEETEAILQLLCLNLQCSREEVVSLLNQVAHIKKQGGEITNNVIREQWKAVEQLFNIVGRLTPDSFRSNRLPLLNLPDNILESLRQGKVEYTKARAIAQLKDEKERHKLLEKVVHEELSVREIRDYINTNRPPQHQDDLLNRVNLAYKKMKQVKVWEDSQKRKLLEKLVLQLEELID